MYDADTILRRQGVMEASRGTFESLWQDVAEHLLPRQADFLGHNLTQGSRRTGRIFDEYAMLALDRGIAAFEGYVMPRGARWQNFEPRDEELLKSQRVRAWYERKTSQLFALRGAPQSGFATQTHESVASLLSFGFQGMWPDLLRDPLGRPLGLFYRSEHIGGLYVMENAWGRIDIIHRKFHLTARQALQKWPKSAPECAVRADRDQKPDEKHCYLHVLEPNREFDPSRIDAKGKPIASCYVSTADKQVFDQGGYRSMPLIASRFDKSPMEDYGRSPGITVLPAVKAAQRIQRDVVTAAEFMARPTLGAHDDMQDQVIEYAPGGITYGAVDHRGNRLVQPLFDGADITPALRLQERTERLIDRAFYADLFLVNQELKSHVSATDILERTQEKGVLLSPLARQETEWFSPMAEREVDLMAEMGLLDDMPPEVREAGGLYQIRYENPLARAMKAEQAGGFYQLLQGVTPLIQGSPEKLQEFFRLYPFEKVVKGLAYIHAVPASWEATTEERAAAEQADAAAANARQLLEAAPIVGQVAKDLSAAGGGDALAA